jgi:arylsulfatase A-like enzyme
MAKMLFYKSSVQVPAIITPPGASQSIIEDGLTESIDLTATILDIAGTEPLEGAQGKSLLPVFDGEDIGREVAYSAIQRGQRGEHDHHLAYYYVMAATDQYRFTFERSTRTPCELFDLINDPNEENNLVDDPAYKGICDDIIKDYIDPHLHS